MPEVHFIGSLDSILASGAVAESGDELCVTWALVPGNEEWYLQKGALFGETHTSSVEGGKALLNHPLDVQFNTESSEGWPRLVCELWSRGDGTRGFLGCGVCWLPPASGHHSISLDLWSPAPSSMAAGLLPAVPALDRLRDIALHPQTRASTQTRPAGELLLSVHTLATKDFGVFGVQM